MKYKAFTLIELVIVIVLIGILVATSLPKFSNLTSQAQNAANIGVSQSFKAAVNIAHAVWLANGEPSSVSLEGQLVYINSSGWPEGTSAVADDAITAAECLELWDGLMTNPPVAATGSCSGLCQFLVTASGTQVCEYSAQNSFSNDTISYNSATGAVSLS